MRIERSTNSALASWVVTVEPGEMVLAASFKDSRGRTVPAKTNQTPLRIGTIDTNGKITQWRVPRNYKEIAKWRLDDALAKLHERGSVFNRAAAQKRKEERRTGMFVIRTTNPSYPENRFHEMKDGYRWVERVLKLSPNGTVAGFFHDKGVYATKPFATQVKSEYGHITHGRLDAWPGSSSSPRASRRSNIIGESLRKAEKIWGKPGSRKARSTDREAERIHRKPNYNESYRGYWIEVRPMGVYDQTTSNTIFDHAKQVANFVTYKGAADGMSKAKARVRTWLEAGITAKGSSSSPRASRHAGPAPRPDALGHLLHKGASKIVRLVTGKK